MVTSENKELAINNQLDVIEDLLEEGPDDGEAPEKYLKRLTEEADNLKACIQELTPEDVEEMFVDDENESED